jgi:mRNA-decapping enzyme subunit 2
LDGPGARDSDAPILPQESFERLLFQVEAAFWFYDDEYREIWPHAFPCYTLLQFAQKLFSMCELLTPFAQRTEELYEKFRQYKIQIPTCGAMLLNPGATKVLLVMGYKSKSWGFPKGKIDRDEEFTACAVREVLEEVGFDISSAIDESVYIEKQHKGLPLTRLYLARNVPDDTPFLTRTKKEIDEIKWHRIADLPTSKEAACKDDKKKSFWMIAPYISWLKEQLAAEKKKKKAGKASKTDKEPPVSAGGDDTGGPSGSSGAVDTWGGKDLSATAALLAALSGVMASEVPPVPSAQSPAAGTPGGGSPAARHGSRQEPLAGTPSAGSSVNAASRRAAKQTEAQGPTMPVVRVLAKPKPGGASASEGREGTGGATAAQGHPFLDFAFDAHAILRALG